MCHQSVGLIQGVFEKLGMATVSVSVCREITEKVRPPRTLYVNFPFGYPLGRPGNTELQRSVVHKALELLHADGPPPVTDEWESRDRPGSPGNEV